MVNIHWEGISMKKTETRGRKADNTNGLYVLPVRVTIDADTRDFLVKIGMGNISAGIRRITKAVSEIKEL